MKNTNKLIRSAAVLCAFLIMTVSGCSNGNDIKSKNDFQEKSYRVSGSINLLDTNDRSATTSFTRLDSLNYSVVAYKGTSTSYEENSAVTATLGGSASDITYSFKLPEAGNWYIVASAKLSIEDEVFVDILTGSKEVDVPDQMAAYNVDAITLNLTGFTENASGSINLVIYDHTNEVSKVDISAKALISKNSVLSQRKISKSGLTFTGTYEPGLTERTLTLEYEDISSDCYEIEFNFLNSNNKKIYSCKEAVTVLGGFVTDKWFQGSSGTGAHLVYDSYNNSTKFIITDELINSYNQAGDLDYPVVLWNARTDENVPYNCDYEMKNGTKTCFILTESTKSDPYPVGINAFGKIKEDTSILSSMGDFTKAFCFDNHEDPPVIYALNDSYEEIYIYKQSYASFKEEEDSIDLNSIINERLDEGTELDSIYPAIAYSNPYIFFFFKTVQDAYYLGAIDVSAADPSDPDNFIFCDTNRSLDNIISMDVDVVNGTTIICYAAASVNGHENELYIRGLKFEGNSIAFDESINSTVEVDASELGITLPGYNISLELTDLQILNDFLYVALSMHSTYLEMYQNGFVKINGEYVLKPIIISNGGIAKIDLANPEEGGIYPFDKWGNNQILLGWRTGRIYSDNQGSNPRTVTLPPYPYNDDDGADYNENDYFYGVRKFVARKPEELVVADDGGYMDIEYDEDGNLVLGSVTAENINRVVTVNLASETLSAVDVDVTFDMTFSSYDGNDSYYGTGFDNN